MIWNVPEDNDHAEDANRRGADPSRVYYPSGYVSFPENERKLFIGAVYLIRV